MTRAKASPVKDWFTIGWAVAAAAASALITIGIWYGNSQTDRVKIDKHDAAIEGFAGKLDVAINRLTDSIKAESDKRERAMQEEAAKRDAVRTEYMSAMGKQTEAFASIVSKISDLGADIKILRSQVPLNDSRNTTKR